MNTIPRNGEDMISIEPDTLPVTIADENVEVTASEVGNMTAGFFRLKVGSWRRDSRPVRS